MVVAIAEYHLRREVRSVLDIGAGEGAWRGELKRLRPGLRYTGLDPSEYVVRRYGKRRNIRLGSFASLPTLRLAASSGYDMIICADVLQYVPDSGLEAGGKALARMLNGVAFLESYTVADDMEGDLEGWNPRSKARYRSLFASAGLVACGMHCYLPQRLAERAVELELA